MRQLADAGRVLSKAEAIGVTGQETERIFPDNGRS